MGFGRIILSFGAGHGELMHIRSLVLLYTTYGVVQIVVVLVTRL